MARKSSSTTNLTNPRARYDYDIKDEYVAGIVLSGAETKSIRMGRASLRGAFVTLKINEAWLNNVQIMPLNINRANLQESDQTRARKLLLKTKELHELTQAKEQSLTIVPLKILTNGRYIKVVIATARGKKAYDKRQVLKQKAEQRDIKRALKQR